MKVCDICKKEIIDTTPLEHNKATQHFYGQVFKANGIMITDMFHLCDDHIDQVIQFITKLKENVK